MDTVTTTRNRQQSGLGPRRSQRPKAVGAQAWLAAVGAWHDTGEPHLLAYALLRLAEAYSQAGDRQEAARAVQRAHAIADRLGAALIAEEAAALACRARLSLQPAVAHRLGVYGPAAR